MGLDPRLGFLSVLIPVIETAWSNRAKMGFQKLQFFSQLCQCPVSYTIGKSLNLSVLQFSHL